MANSKIFPVVLLLSLFIALHVHGKESRFFRKFMANSEANPSNEQSESLEKQSQDRPSFVADNQNGFGLYGHVSGQLPPSDTATSAAATTAFSDEPFYNKDVFATDDETIDDTKAMLQGSYDTAAVNRQNNFPRETYGTVVANGRYNYYTVGNRYAANDDNNVQQQQQQQEEEGMSDMRFVENGKYYYNTNDEEKYDPARYTNSRTTEFNNNNQGGYYGDSYAAAASAGGYEPEKDMNEFQGTKNLDEEFMP